MGIRYMSKFLHTYPVRLLDEIEVSDTTVVIDGSELMYHLYFQCGQLEIRCGAEYTSFRAKIQQFIEVLEQCRIKPFVVFDSFKSENNITRYLQGRKNKLASIRQLVSTGTSEGSVKPLFGKEVLRQTLVELNVTFVVVPGDADAEIAEIANELDAMVLASDTDFCIFDLKKGFLILDDLQWWQVKGAQRSIRGKIFHQSIFEETFGTAANTLCILEPLMSNQDGIPGVNFDDFVRSLQREVQIPNRLRRMKFRRPNYIECVLLWLNNYRNDEQIIALIKKQVPNLPEDKFKECIRMYREKPNVDEYVDTMRSGGQSADIQPDCFATVDGMREPVSFLPVMVDDQDQDSSHRISSSIRQATYEIDRVIKFTLEEDADVTEWRIVEMDRVDHDYGANIVMVHVPDEEQIHPLYLQMTAEELRDSDNREEIMKARKDYILKTIVHEEDFLRVASLGTNNELLASTVIYWTKGQDPMPPDEVCKALALTFACISHGIGAECLPDEFRRILDNSFDKVALHFSAQWQTCVGESMRLNCLMGCPLSNPKIGKLFSGMFFQKAFAFFLQNADLSNADVTSLIFGDNEDPKQYFESIVRLMFG